MFGALHTLAARAALHLLIVAEGERLRITLQPKPTGDAPPPPPLQLVATPAEFDAGFVDAVAAYQAPVVSLLEQAGAAAASVAEAATKAAEAKPAAPAKKAARTAKRLTNAERDAAAEKTGAALAKVKADRAAARAEKKRQAEERAAQAAAEKKRQAEAKKAEREAQRTTRTRRGAEPTPEETEAARAACIADVRAYLALTAGSKPSRAGFLATMPATGRRYERLFASFDELVAAAQQQELPIAETPAASAADHVVDANKLIDGPAATDDNSQSASQTGEPVTLANMEAPPPQATAGLFSGEPELDGDAKPASEINGAAQPLERVKSTEPAITADAPVAAAPPVQPAVAGVPIDAAPPTPEPPAHATNTIAAPAAPVFLNLI